MKYADILRENSLLGDQFDGEKYNIRVLSNVTTNQLGEILEYASRVKGIYADVSFGDYDNIIQESGKSSDAGLTIIFWELCNYIDGLHYRAGLLSEEELAELEQKAMAEIGLVCNQLKDAPLVLFNRFSSMLFDYNQLQQSRLNLLVCRLNSYLERIAPVNVHLVDIEKTIATAGARNSFDARRYYSSKILYTIDFLQVYAAQVMPYILAANGAMKKALIFDCDNTLWGGVLGEDGFEHIRLSPDDPAGSIFSEVQGLALLLSRNHGVLLGLCSKNNASDVDRVLHEHPHILMQDDDIVIKKVDWNDKASNLKAISEELNIGLDSMVFIDDSPFEVNLIRERLPEVLTLQVPKKIHEYPILIREVMGLFFGLARTDEDLNKSRIYRQQEQRKSAQLNFNDIDDYLASLGLVVSVRIDEQAVASRLAQLSQKTNQFNLTTKRYTEADILKFISDPDVRVISISVSDKFGDNGIVGLCIVKLDRHAGIGEIDTLLMSCRVLGRNIEYIFLNIVIGMMQREGASGMNAAYEKTAKNEQVSDYYDRCGFERVETDSVTIHYLLDLNGFAPKEINYIEVKYG